MPDGNVADAAIAQAPSTPGQTAAPAQQPNAAYSTPKRPTKLIAAVVAVVIIVIGVSALLLTSVKSPQGTGSSTISPQKPDLFNASIMSFVTLGTLSTVFAPVSPSYYVNHSTLLGRAGALRYWPCFGINKAVLIYSFANATPLLLNASIEARLDKALPLVFTSTAILFNYSNVSENTRPASCRYLYIFSNKSYAQSLAVTNITAQIGADARLYKVVNMTAQGLAYEGFSYSGTLPMLSFYVVSFAYRSVEMNVGIFMFSQYANDTKVISLAKAVFGRLVNYTA